MLANLIHPSGGLKYHFRARRFQHSLWMPYLKQIDSWLSGLNVQKKNLMLIGASGGYTLPRSWLHSFQFIQVIDPDPLAKFIFLKNIEHSNVSWDKKNYFVDINHFFRRLSQIPEDTFIVFCNFWGQIHFIYPDFVYSWPKNWETTILRELEKFNWASFHDIYSGVNLLPQDVLIPKRPRPWSSLSDTSWLETILPVDSQVTFHETPIFNIASSDTFQYGTWQITPKQWQLIEFYFSGGLP